MSETLNTLYRLFAPLIVVVVIIAGVNLSSSLIKNAKERQTATSIAYAQACPVGTSPAVPNQSPPDPKNPGQYIPTPCAAATPGGPVPGMSDPATGCCKGSANQKSAKDAAKGGAGGAMKGMTDLLKSLASMLKPKEKQPKPPEPPKTPDNRPPKPVCKSLSVSPTIPLRPGESATLTWVLDGGMPDAVIVTPGVGAVSGFSVKVKPRSSTTYTVTARNARGSSTCPKVRVYVGPNDESDDVFNDNNSSGNSGNNSNDDIWGNGNVDNSAAQNASKSSYDDLWNGQRQDDAQKSEEDLATGQDDTNDGDDYYDFLSGLAESDDSETKEPEEPKEYDEYYYGNDGDAQNWDEIENIKPSWDNIDLQGNDIGEADANSLELGMRENNYNNYSDDGYVDYGDDGNLAYNDTRNSNGLTDQEIYGVWNRPQSPATGGLGLSGGYGGGFSSSASNVPIHLSTTQESQSIFGRIGRWFKNTFCFWCD